MILRFVYKLRKNVDIFLFAYLLVIYFYRAVQCFLPHILAFLRAP